MAIPGLTQALRQITTRLAAKGAANGAAKGGVHAAGKAGMLASLKGMPMKGKLLLLGVGASAFVALNQLAKGGGGYNPAGTGVGPDGYKGPGAGIWHYLTNPVQGIKQGTLAALDTATGGKVDWIRRARARASQTHTTDIGGKIAKGQVDHRFADTNIGDVIGGTLSPEEELMIGMMDEKDRARYLLQKRMQERAEMAALLSQLQALRHQTAMQVINNIR